MLFCNIYLKLNRKDKETEIQATEQMLFCNIYLKLNRKDKETEIQATEQMLFWNKLWKIFILFFWIFYIS